jgi:adenylate cyclase
MPPGPPSSRARSSPIDIVAVKGKQRGVRVYELLALASDHDRDAEALAADATTALDAYCARDFAAAIAAWAKVLARRPGDRPAQIMTERATELLARPPDERWSAVMIAKEK